MEEYAFSRTRRLLGAEAMRRLENARVAVFGIGGVGGYVCEALARSGVGALDLVDSDTVALTNLNRQIIATRDTIGQRKTDVMRARIYSVNPSARVETYPYFFLPENAASFPFAAFDYIVDAVDTVAAKLALVEAARTHGVPIISCMGTGNKLDPTRLRVSDISKTSVDPLARVMRRELRARGVTRLRVVWSDETPLEPIDDGEQPAGSRRAVPGSTAFVPPAAGLILASEVVRDLTAAIRGE